MPKIDFANMYNYISECNSIDQLIVQYNILLDSNEFNNSRLLYAISEFISKLHIRVMTIECKEVKEAYNKNLNDVMILKRKLLTLLQFRNTQYNNYSGAYNDGITKEKYR